MSSGDDSVSNTYLTPLGQSADKQVLFARLGQTKQIHKILLVRSGRARWESFAALIGHAGERRAATT
jgi:hypothetical protein